MKGLLLSAGLSLAFSLSVLGSEGQVNIEPRPNSNHAAESPDLRAESALVLIPAHVTRANGASVMGLVKDNFRVTENDVEQQIAYFVQDDAPVSVGILLDISGSMGSKIGKATEAAAAFFRTSNPEDEFSLVEFSDRAKLCVPFTRDVDEVAGRIMRTHPFGRTALLDAVHLALNGMKKARNQRRAIVIISDGGDNWSRHSAREVKNQLLESEVQVFAMGIFDSANVIPGTLEERNGPRLLSDLAEQSGGKHYRVEKLVDLPEISARIGGELRNQYLLGYYPDSSLRDGKYHSIKVELRGDDLSRQLRAEYRRGYYAPSH